MQSQTRECARKFFLSRIISPQLPWRHGRQEFVPHEVQDALQVSSAAGDGHHRILFGHDDAKLSEGSVPAITSMTAAPELITVTLLPVARRVAAIGSLAGGGRLDPCGRDQLLTVPFAFLQVKLAQAGDVFGPDVQSRAAERDSLPAFPGRIFNPQRIEEAWPKIIEHRHAGRLLHRSEER